MTLQSILDELSTVIATAPSDSLGAVIIQLASFQSAAAARLLNGQHDAAERKMPLDKDGALLTISQAANQMNMPKSYVYELVRQGKLEGKKIGKYVRVTQETLAKFIATAASSVK